MKKEVSWLAIIWMWSKRVLILPFMIWFVIIALVEIHKHDSKKGNWNKSKKRANFIIKFTTFMFDSKGTYINERSDYGNCVFISNHPSPAGAATLEKHLQKYDVANFVASDDQWFTNFWALEKIFANSGVTFVDRRFLITRSAALFKTLKQNQQGQSVLVYPEGNLTHPTNKQYLEAFHSGAFKIANQNQVPIVPIVETNTAHRFRNVPLERQFTIAKIRPKYYFLEPYTKHLEKNMTEEEIKNELWNIIQIENQKHIVS